MEYEKLYSELYQKGYHQNPLLSNAVSLIPEIEKLSFNSILDVGCSRGFAVHYFRKQGKQAYGIDIVPEAVQLSPYLTQANATHLPYPDNTFDVVMSTDTLEHLTEEDATKAINEIMRVSKQYICMKIATSKDGEDYGIPLHLTIKPINDWIQLFCPCLTIYEDNKESFIITKL